MRSCAACARRRRPARPQLPRRLRRELRPRHRLERLPGRARSASSRRAATWRSSSASSPARRSSASRGSPRSATRPTSTWPSWSASFAEHAPTEVIAVYAEDFRDGRAFVDAAAAAAKPVVLLTVGASEASARAALLAHRRARLELRGRRGRGRAPPASTWCARPHEMVDLMQALVRARPLRGPRIAVLGDGGGHGAIACDIAVGGRPRGAAALRRALGRPGRPAAEHRRDPATRSTWPAAASRTSCPTPRSTRALLESDEVDGVLMTGLLRRLQPVLGGVRRHRGRASPAASSRPCTTPAGRWSRTRCTTTRRRRPRAARGRRARLPEHRGGRRRPGRAARAARAAGRAAPAGSPERPGRARATSAAARCSPQRVCRSSPRCG